MHVLLLNQAFHPDVAATAQMAKDLADHLVARGHRVTAVASRSLYGQAGATLPKRELLDGIDVRRVGFSLFGKGRIAARVADFALFHVLAALRVVTLPKADVVVSFTTPPFIAIVGLLARTVRGSRAVIWSMDLYPDLPIACGVLRADSLAARLLSALNRAVMRASDVTVVLGRCMQERVVAQGVPRERVVLITTWADVEAIRPVPREDNPVRASWGLGDAFTVMHSGNYGLGHDAATACRAMARLAGRTDVRFELIGGGKRQAEIQRFIDEHGLRQARWRAYEPRERLRESLGAGDVHLVTLLEDVLGIMVPSKLYGILAAGRPTIFVGPPASEIARVLVEHDCGLVVRPGDDEGLAAAIVALADDPERCRRMGRNARAAIEGRHDRRTTCGAWGDLLERLAAGGGPAPEAARPPWA